MSSAVPPDGTYSVEAQQQGTCLELTNGAAGTALTTWSCSGSQSQQWQLQCNSGALTCAISNVQYPSLYAIPPASPLGANIESGSQPFGWAVQTMNGGYLFCQDTTLANGWFVENDSSANDTNVGIGFFDTLFHNPVWMLNPADSSSQNSAPPETTPTPSPTASNSMTSIDSGASVTPVSSPNTTSAAPSPSISLTNPAIGPIDTTSGASVANFSLPQLSSTSHNTDTVTSSSIDNKGASALKSPTTSTVSDGSAAGSTAKPSGIDSSGSHSSVNVGEIVGMVICIVMTALLVFASLSWKRGWFCFHKRRGWKASITPFPPGFEGASTEHISQVPMSSHEGYPTTLEIGDISFSGETELPSYEESRTTWDLPRRLETGNVYKHR
ncbi:hypothetical protein CERSUDRAFT_96576 [Gelatoporia subvermispora B]|uniref:Ricin B lectin domain-containing protein n=1 Tax=Ceriporiopsis subvermispora (strain B) TaxID=914234 RepID=M2PHE7_CERS8|nr:hypothetical protein CERSUDRAFT_96576 [Gelatoporia subvermispora B]